MASISHNCLLLFILTLRLSLILAELINIFTDLSTDSFTNPKSQWICSNYPESSLVSSCGSYHMLGGPGIFGAKAECSINFSSLDPHYSMSMSFTFLKINVWQNESFLISIDNEPKKLLTFQVLDDTSVKICPTTTAQDAIRAIAVNVSHSQSSLSVAFSSTISQNEGFWGLRSFVMNIDTCHSTCTQCEGPGPNQCTGCVRNAGLSQQGACLCNDGFFLKAINSCVGWQCSSCEPCQSNCKTCFGDTGNSCFTCVKGSFFKENACVGEYECPQGFYADWDTSQCEICQANCQTCEKSASFCTSCKSPYFLQGNSCVSSCDDGCFGAMNGRVCSKCLDSCRTCAFFAWNCTSCPLFSGVYLTEQGNCLNYCPSGYWKNSATLTCDKCSENCATCEFSSTFCTSCRFPLYLSMNNCVSSCPDAYFREEVLRKCTHCHNSCLECERISTNCTACEFPKVFQENRCLDECSPGFYLETSGVSRQCERCDESCMTCSLSSGYCTGCISSKVLSLSANCLENCPIGQFKSQGVCQECDEICSVCQNRPDYCVQCAEPLLFASEGACVSVCPGNTYTYQEKRQCLTCDEQCNGCFGPGKSQCLACFTNKFLYKHECLDICPNYTFVQGGSCELCGQESCISCENQGICEVCQDDYYLNSKKMCEKKQVVEANFSDIDNPFAFKLSFNHSFSEAELGEIAGNAEFALKNEQNSSDLVVFNTFVQKSNIYFEIIFKETIENAGNFLTISLKPPENATFSLQIQNSSHELRVFSAICDQKQSFYDFSAKACKPKRMMGFSLQYSSNPLQYYLQTSGFLENERRNSSNFLTIACNATDFSSNIIPDNTETLLVNLVFFSDVFNGPLLIIHEDFPLDYVFSQHLAFKNRESSIKLRDFYNASAATLELTRSAGEMMSFSEVFSEINLYFNVILSGDSSFLIQGLMLLNLVDFLRFTRVNYPMNLNSLFSAKSAKKDMFGIGKIAVDAENAGDLPENFAFYGISPYFLNNTASLFLQLALILAVEGLVKAVWMRKSRLRRLKYGEIAIKTLKMLKRVFFWMALFNFLFSKYQFFVIFTVLGLKFNKFNTLQAKIDLFFAVLSAIFFVFLPVHVYFLIQKVCKSSLFQRKSRVFPTKVEEIPNNPEKKPEEIEAKDIENPTESEKTLRSPYRFHKNLKIMTRIPREEIAITPVNLVFSETRDTRVKEQWSAVLQENDSQMTSSKKDREKEPKLENFGQEINEINEGIDVEKKFKEGLLDERQYKGLSFFFHGNLNSLGNSTPPQSDCDSKPPISKEKPAESPRNAAKSKEKPQRRLTKAKILEFFARIRVKCPPWAAKVGKWAYFLEKSQEKRVGKRLGFLARDFKHEKKAQDLYIFVDLLRHGVLSLIFVVFFEFPLEQLALLCTFNALFFGFVLFSRAFARKTLMFMTIVNESIVNLALFSALFIAIYDASQEKYLESRVFCGWMIIFSSVFLVYSLVITTFLKLVGNLYALRRYFVRKNGRVAPENPRKVKEIASFRLD